MGRQIYVSLNCLLIILIGNKIRQAVMIIIMNHNRIMPKHLTQSQKIKYLIQKNILVNHLLGLYRLNKLKQLKKLPINLLKKKKKV